MNFIDGFIGIFVSNSLANYYSGGLFDIKWVLEGVSPSRFEKNLILNFAQQRVMDGPLCTTQGLFKQYGDVFVAFMYVETSAFLNWENANIAF